MNIEEKREYNQLSSLYEEREIVEIELKLKRWSLWIKTRSKKGEGIIYTISLKKPSLHDLLILISNPEILETVEEELKKIDKKIGEDIEKLKKTTTLVEMMVK